MRLWKRKIMRFGSVSYTLAYMLCKNQQLIKNRGPNNFSVTFCLKTFAEICLKMFMYFYSVYGITVFTPKKLRTKIRIRIHACESLSGRPLFFGTGTGPALK
jgi:hypothetical protein